MRGLMIVATASVFLTSAAMAEPFNEVTIGVPVMSIEDADLGTAPPHGGCEPTATVST
ncbi:hypothetical protein [Pseudophaeobacter flagellatus]|uniref:hypothetical protein n=1 Tax=Pseudophaeobacter flagellatus TaxID=2899119 RepID=UPI001E626982|nr:hypothetical protein [Pseudophaeobacter flagellatus]